MIPNPSVSAPFHGHSPPSHLYCLLSSPTLAPLREIFALAPACPDIFRQHQDKQDKMDCLVRYFRTLLDIFGHFWTLSWETWAISLAIFRKYRHFARQSLNTHSPPPDISDICEQLLVFSSLLSTLSFLPLYSRSRRESPPSGISGHFPPIGAFCEKLPPFFDGHCPPRPCLASRPLRTPRPTFARAVRDADGSTGDLGTPLLANQSQSRAILKMA